MAPSDATSTPPESADGAARIAVLLPLGIDTVYDYLAADPASVPEGAFVRAPLGHREVVGVVWRHVGEDEEIDLARDKLKHIGAVLPVPPMPESLRKLVDWVAEYTLAKRGAVLRMAMSVPAALEPAKRRTAYLAGEETPERLTPARKRVFEVLADGLPRGAAELAREAAVGAGVVRALAKAGALRPVSLPAWSAPERPDWRRARADLSPGQQAAADALTARVAESAFSVTLLDGVTGSGKTEVYFEAVAKALEMNRQVLVMLPEIALSAQWLERFRARFGAAPLVWHSELVQRARRENWRAVASGEARIVVGARSALWLPFAELGLIVADEEHDGAFKQEDGVIYHARDMAVMRARLTECPLVLSSATPSLESLANAEAGRYRSLHLPDRHGGAQLPAIETVDMRGDPPPRGAWLSPPLREALEQCFAAGQQAVLFLNRRGYAPLPLCRACGHRLDCPNCSAWLVAHRFTETLNCHHCGYFQRPPEACPECEAEGRMAACGPGVERVAEEAAALFPDIRSEIVTSDTVAGPGEAADFIARIEKREIDLVIGTQIIAKGHHFPLLTLVGVVDSDLGLAGGDLRAAERTYQLLHQVAGRAGRAHHAGRVLLQTYMPEHPVMAALSSGEREAFLKREAEARESHGQPPDGRLAAVILSGRNEASVANTARALARIARGDLPAEGGMEVLGPAPAPLALLRGRYRYRLLVKCTRALLPQPWLRRWLAALNAPSRVSLRVDVDPYSFN
ncbi:MAG: primosomal protein N' [Rhodospirillaceae bacterium]|nr:primosomal protein N' [Rhodospirillaceae bacterium]